MEWTKFELKLHIFWKEIEKKRWFLLYELKNLGCHSVFFFIACVFHTKFLYICRCHSQSRVHTVANLFYFFFFFALSACFDCNTQTLNDFQNCTHIFASWRSILAYKAISNCLNDGVSTEKRNCGDRVWAKNKINE